MPRAVGLEGGESLHLQPRFGGRNLGLFEDFDFCVSEYVFFSIFACWFEGESVTIGLFFVQGAKTQIGGCFGDRGKVGREGKSASSCRVDSAGSDPSPPLGSRDVPPVFHEPLTKTAAASYQISPSASGHEIAMLDPKRCRLGQQKEGLYGGIEIRLRRNLPGFTRNFVDPGVLVA